MIKLICLWYMFCCSFVEIKGQNNPCYRFIDTSYVKARIIHIWDPNCCCECTAMTCIIENSDEKKQAISIFDDISSPVEKNVKYMCQDTTLLLLVTYLSDRQFALMKYYLDDSLSKQYSREQIYESLVFGVPADSIGTYLEWKVTEDEKSIGNLMYMGDGMTNTLSLILPSSKIPIDTICDNNHGYCYQEFPFESWGIIVEVQRECNFFFYETAEMALFDRNYQQLKLFIPLKEKE